jgi:hypothetical protein
MMDHILVVASKQAMQANKTLYGKPNKPWMFVFGKHYSVHLLLFCQIMVLFNVHFVYLLSYCCTEGTSWHLQRFLQYIIVEFTTYTILLYPLSPHSRNCFRMSHLVHNISTAFTLPHPFFISFPPFILHFILSFLLLFLKVILFI